MTSSWSGSLEFHNIQEMVDIELMFELICMFFCLLSSLQIIRKRGNNSKTGERSKLFLYCCAIVKYMCLFFYQLTAICPIRYLGDRL